MQESESCHAEACWTDFGDWGDCSVSCGGTGTRTKSKSCVEPEQGSGGLPCPSQNTEEAKSLLFKEIHMRYYRQSISLLLFDAGV